MKYIKTYKRMYEELDADTYRNASYKLHNLGYIDRSDRLMMYSTKKYLDEIDDSENISITYTVNEDEKSVTAEFYPIFTLDKDGTLDNYSDIEFINESKKNFISREDLEYIFDELNDFDIDFSIHETELPGYKKGYTITFSDAHNFSEIDKRMIKEIYEFIRLSYDIISFNISRYGYFIIDIYSREKITVKEFLDGKNLIYDEDEKGVYFEIPALSLLSHIESNINLILKLFSNFKLDLTNGEYNEIMLNKLRKYFNVESYIGDFMINTKGETIKTYIYKFYAEDKWFNGDGRKDDELFPYSGYDDYEDLYDFFIDASKFIWYSIF